jgi:hypothetical protein
VQNQGVICIRMENPPIMIPVFLYNPSLTQSATLTEKEEEVRKRISSSYRMTDNSLVLRISKVCHVTKFSPKPITSGSYHHSLFI